MFSYLYYKCHKINFSRGGSSYLSSLYWIKNKKATINVITVALNHDEIKKDLQRVTKIKRFVKKYNWEGIKFSSQKDDWKKFEKNNVTIALNVLYVKEEKIYPAYVSKHNSNHKKQVIILMIPNREG